MCYVSPPQDSVMISEPPCCTLVAGVAL
uniref:Uncharacterized protein n=1 Tax=Anguilla anguilla TaxID=7936 RepID=A0A0E9Q2S7_ANGAN